ncbi:hypothetical protein ACH3XW_33640 [Acanthocheilonema viteae]
MISRYVITFNTHMYFRMYFRKKIKIKNPLSKMQNDIFAVIIPIDPTMLACAVIIVAIALIVELITHLCKLRIVILKERKRKIAEIPFLLSDFNNLEKNAVYRRTI